jgi:two-component system LytT family sensor kinase
MQDTQRPPADPADVASGCGRDASGSPTGCSAGGSVFEWWRREQDVSMADRTRAQTHWGMWLSALAVFYTGVAVTLATQDYLLQPRRGGWTVPWLAFVGERIAEWIVWTAWTPLVVWLGGRFRLDQAPRLRAIAVHAAALVAGVPLIFVSGITLAELVTLPGSGRTFSEKFFENFRLPWPWLAGWALMGALTWLLVLTVSYAWRYRREHHEQVVETSALRAELAEAQLRSLKSQLQPHFLFNSLNAVATLATADPPAARRVVLLLSGLLRRALSEANVQEVPLSSEIEFARAYLEIEQVRFSNRLSVDVSIAPGSERVLVPHLVLQPLVENAVRHGIEPKAEPGAIRIQAGLAPEGLRLTVTDDGVGPSQGSRRAGAGLGLANVRARLARLYGDQARLDCGARAGGGFTASIVLPVHFGADERRAVAAEGRPS